MGAWTEKHLSFVNIAAVPCKVDRGDYQVDGWKLFGLTASGQVFTREAGSDSWYPIPGAQKVYDPSLPTPPPKDDEDV